MSRGLLGHPGLHRAAALRLVASPLALILLVALVPRLAAIRWGLPDVLEEATPLRRAWDMWGWGPARSFDPNPHFFNYPGLTIYLQWIAQSLLLAWLRLTGIVHSVLAFRALYVTDPTAFLVTGRLVGVCFSLGTIAVLYAIGRRLGGRSGGIVAAGLLALNPVHVSQSVVVETDVPLTFFVTLAMLAALRILEAPDRRTSILAGIAAGLAASAKYPGALAMLPVFAAQLATRGARRHIAATIGAAAAAFVLTSPFVLLDARSFWRDLATEREHMRAGHFGLEAAPAWSWYGAAIVRRLLGWPAALLALVALAWNGVVRRRRWALVLAAFIVPFVAVIGSWSMRGDRYALPLVPAALAACAGMAGAMPGGEPARRTVVPARIAIPLLTIALLAGCWQGWTALRDRVRPAAHTLARRWIETHVPAGAMIVSELSGPRLVGPLELAPLEAELRDVILGEGSGPSTRRPPVYAVQLIPMFQVEPERSAPFYDPALYAMADYIVVMGQVAGRYRAEPERFPRQLEFYASLERDFTRAAWFRDPGGRGHDVTVYANPASRAAFAKRARVPGPAALRAGTESGEETFFLYNLGLNYEMFGFPDAAIASYASALRFSAWRPGIFANVALGMARCLAMTGRGAEAEAFLATTEASARDEVDRDAIRRARDGLRYRSRGAPGSR